MSNGGAQGTRAATGGTAAASQTLSRGIRILEILADASSPLTIDEVAAELGVHRSNAYRLLRTLEEHGLVGRDSAGRLALGARMASLAAGVAHDLQAEALPELTTVANELGMTCFLAIRDHDMCTTLASIEPRHAVASVAQRPGASHPITVGAPGKAIVAQLPRSEWPDGMSHALRAEVEKIAAAGYATSHNEVIPSVQSVAVPLALRGRQPAAIAVVHVAPTLDVERIVEHLGRSAAAIKGALGG
ncbi:IclR family transcriptional regulator [Paramicrobacterium chengjingii]|uniref:IclR family transcriptional regulator n=1 Tax=Paramicrobacterium chengjingii TaxID=2769067 RepID=UPI001421A85A|nr:IclR family transcriptional regulator [Microbacterium chengjingii]